MIAAGTGFAELAIDNQEAHLLADAAADVAKHYDFLPDPRTQAWLNLAMVAGAIYGPRVWAISARKPGVAMRAASGAAADASPLAAPIVNGTQRPVQPVEDTVIDWAAMAAGRA